MWNGAAAGIGTDGMQSALVTYVTAGFPTVEETPDIMMAMEAGGAGTHTKQPARDAMQGKQPIDRTRHY